jgi:hypothetical protein
MYISTLRSHIRPMGGVARCYPSELLSTVSEDLKPAQRAGKPLPAAIRRLRT